MKNIECPFCNQLTFTKWQILRVGRFSHLSCDHCKNEVTVQLYKVVLFSIYSQLTGLFGMVAAFSLFSGPYPLISFSVIGVVGYVLGVIPAIYIYLHTTQFIVKNA